MNMLCEVAALTAIITKKNSVIPFYNFNFLVHQLLWLTMAVAICKKHFSEYTLVILFFLFGLLNLLFLENKGLTYSTFLVGAFAYMTYYIWKSYVLLSSEKLNYFASNQFILLSSPILFFFALSFVLAFRESEMATIKIGDRSLYNVLQFIGNLSYYALLILYIIKSRNEKSPAHD
jgi:hypothetical protein